MYAENLKKIRKKLGLSVAKFAEKLEMSASTLTGYELRKRIPSIMLCTQLYRKLNINLNWFVSGNGDMFNKSTSDFEQTKKEIIDEVKKMLKNEGIVK